MEDLSIARSAGADRQGGSAAVIAGACALTLAFLLVLVLAAPASAAVRDFRVGVIEGAVDPATDVPAMGRANVQTLRIMFNWRRAEPAGTQAGTCPGQYDWTLTDPLVREASRQDVRLLPVILGSPGYVSADPRNPPDTGRAEIGNYKCFVRALVARYGRGGNLPANNPDVQPIEDWQVWNEPNLDQYSVNGASPRPREYARLLRITSKRIRNVDPAATIVMAGLPENPSEGMGAREFLSRFYRSPGVRQTFDVLALHPYALNYRGVEGAVQRLRQFLGSVGDRGRYMWITEIGWATHGQPGPRSFLEKSDRGQARQLQGPSRMLRNNRQRLQHRDLHLVPVARLRAGVRGRWAVQLHRPLPQERKPQAVLRRVRELHRRRLHSDSRSRRERGGIYHPRAAQRAA